MVKREKKKRYIKQKLFIHKDVPKKKDALDPPTSMTLSSMKLNKWFIKEKKRGKKAAQIL